MGVGCSGRGAARTDGIGAGNVVESGSPRHICGVGDTLAEEREGTLVRELFERGAHVVSHVSAAVRRRRGSRTTEGVNQRTRSK